MEGTVIAQSIDELTKAVVNVGQVEDGTLNMADGLFAIARAIEGLTKVLEVVTFRVVDDR